MSIRYRPLLVAAMIIALLVILNPPRMHASSDGEWLGTISGRPSGTVGEWTVGGRIFLVDASTEVKQEHGPLVVGACAELEFYTSGSSNIATEIGSEPAHKCRGDGGGGGGDESGRLDRYARVEQFPSTLVGTWTIGGVDYTAIDATRFEQKYGNFAIGGCVEVTFTTNGSGVNTILKLETEQPYKCDRSGGSRSQRYGVVGTFPEGLIGDWEIDGTIYQATATTRFEQEYGTFFSGGCVDLKFQTDTRLALEISSAEAYNCGTGSGTQPLLQKAYGRVSAIPAGNIGVWTVGGGAYTATSSTRFELEHGALTVGSCGKVAYSISNGENIAVKISSEELTKCNTSSYRNAIRGFISVMPADRYGSWTIAGMLLEATTDTRFEEEHGLLAVGGCVKASYYVQGGVTYVEEIESRPAAYCSGGASPEQPVLAKVYATIDTLPPSPYTGTWVIGGVSYRANTETRFQQEAGAFTVGSCVEASYTSSDSGNLLHKVETESAPRCQVGAQPVSRAYGVVESSPDPIGAGIWRISGVDYQATATTRLEQEYGFLVIGAYVEVTYQIDGTVLTAVAIETHVAPGSGRNTTAGSLESRPTEDTGTWIIDGTTYQGDPAINVNLGSSGMQALSTTTNRVMLNSYRGIDGIHYLTAITTVNGQVYIPLIVR